MQDLNRCLINDWGLPFTFFNEISVRGQFKSFARECRVRAIQTVLENKDMSETIMYHPILDKYFSEQNETNYHGKLLPFGKFKTVKDVWDWNSHIFETTYKKYNHDRIEHDWKKRIDYISNNIE